MSNIINAIINLINDPKHKLMDYATENNRANNMGTALEEYIKDLFAGTVNERNESKRNIAIEKTFSYLGNQNNPPDSILKGGDAIEVKKIELDNSPLALNSSYPKHKLYSDSPMISNACRYCENWREKDIIYAVGVVKQGLLTSFCMVYGEDYAADPSVYEKIKGVIKDGVESIPNVEFAETRELGRVNRVDPLGISFLRVRGMWHIENPFRVFRYVFERQPDKALNFMCLINASKYASLENRKELEALVGHIDGLSIADVKIKNPNNPAQLRGAKLIAYLR